MILVQLITFGADNRTDKIDKALQDIVYNALHELTQGLSTFNPFHILNVTYFLKTNFVLLTNIK